MFQISSAFSFFFWSSKLIRPIFPFFTAQFYRFIFQIQLPNQHEAIIYECRLRVHSPANLGDTRAPKARLLCFQLHQRLFCSLFAPLHLSHSVSSALSIETSLPSLCQSWFSYDGSKAFSDCFELKIKTSSIHKKKNGSRFIAFVTNSLAWR